MARALTQAKVAEGKFPKRDLVAAIQEAPRSEGKAPILVEIHRSSMHHGRLEIDPSKVAMQMAALALGACLPGVVGVGVQTDISFGGQYEDLEAVKKSTQMPVICNDFVVYGYQLFRVRANIE